MSSGGSGTTPVLRRNHGNPRSARAEVSYEVSYDTRAVQVSAAVYAPRKGSVREGMRRVTDAGEIRQLVVVGSSAGGIDALSELVRTLPADFPAPIVVAQHLDPHHVSHLSEILAPLSILPVRIVTDQTPLEQGVIFVVPANRHVEINDHSISLIDGYGRPKPSIDLLLTTSAAIFGEGLIAVILTGLGSDGSAGARDVKAAGGTVIIQNPDTAKFDSMPRSLAPTSVDIVANLEKIGAVLHDLLTGAYVVAPEGENRQLRAFL